MSRWEAETLLCRYEQTAGAECRRCGTPASEATPFLPEDRHTVGSDDAPADKSGMSEEAVHVFSDL
jgi:hypothetical protein